MRRLINGLIATFIAIFFISAQVNAAWFRDTETLATINGISYSTEDFRHWWENWREAGQSFPFEPKKFIEWKLMAQEGMSMELNQEPDFLRRMEIFYKARTRVMLKYDVVDSKIQITDEDIAARYRENYTPIWHLSLIYFDTAEKAEKAFRDIVEKQYTFEELTKQAGPNGPYYKDGNFRPHNFGDNSELLQAVQNLVKGEVAKPQKLKNYHTLIRLDEKETPPASELEKHKRYIREILWKEQENLLTERFIDELWKKFDVQVDEQLFSLVNTPELDRETLSRPVATASRGDMPLWRLVNDVRRDYNLQRNKQWTSEEKEKRARGFLKGMIVEYLLTWEAEDRHYEEKPPFKWTYQFYQESSLIKQLEKRMIAPKVNISEADIVQYYEENLDSFRPPEIISVVIMSGDENQINKTREKIAQGHNLAKLTEEYGMSTNAINDKISRLAPQVVEAVKDIKIGEVSEPFKLYDKPTLAKLVDRKIQDAQPLEEVRDKVISIIKAEKFAQERQKYIALILEQSEITINNKNWDKLRAEFTN